MEKTLLIVKPDAVRRGLLGRIITELEENHFKIKGIRMKTFAREEAERFYGVHQGKDFFEGLVEFIMSGPVVGILLEGEGVIEKIRQLIGATDPRKAQVGTIRYRFGEDIRRNAVHASDGPDTAEFEIPFFFD